MPGPLSSRHGGKGASPRPPPSLQRRPAAPAPLRRMPTPPPAVDHASTLPPEVVRALRLVAAELRDMPRDCARDREELVHWHGRLARRLDAVVASKARLPAPAKVEEPIAATAPLQPVSAAPKRVSAVDQVCRNVPRPLPARSPPATHWRARPVDAAFRRRSEAAGQLALFAPR